MKLATPIIKEQMSTLPVYVTQSSTDYIEQGISRNCGYIEYHIIQGVDGIGEFICQGKVYQIDKGDIILFAPSIPHAYHQREDSISLWKLDWLCFLCNGEPTFINQIMKDGHMVLKADDAPDLCDEFSSITSILQTENIYNQFQASVILYKMLTEILAYKLKIQGTLQQDSKFENVIRHMEVNLSKPVCIEELSEVANVSVSYLCRKFKSIYKISPIRYLIDLRMMKAKNMLTDKNDYTIKKISAECGYSDTSYFCQEFKRHYRTSPLEYKKRFMVQDCADDSDFAESAE